MFITYFIKKDQSQVVNKFKRYSLIFLIFTGCYYSSCSKKISNNKSKIENQSFEELAIEAILEHTSNQVTDPSSFIGIHNILSVSPFVERELRKLGGIQKNCIFCTIPINDEIRIEHINSPRMNLIVQSIDRNDDNYMYASTGEYFHKLWIFSPPI